MATGHTPSTWGTLPAADRWFMEEVAWQLVTEYNISPLGVELSRGGD